MNLKKEYYYILNVFRSYAWVKYISISLLAWVIAGSGNIILFALSSLAVLLAFTSMTVFNDIVHRFEDKQSKPYRIIPSEKIPAIYFKYYILGAITFILLLSIISNPALVLLVLFGILSSYYYAENKSGNPIIVLLSRGIPTGVAFIWILIFTGGVFNLRAFLVIIALIIFEMNGNLLGHIKDIEVDSLSGRENIASKLDEYKSLAIAFILFLFGLVLLFLSFPTLTNFIIYSIVFTAYMMFSKYSEVSKLHYFIRAYLNPLIFIFYSIEYEFQNSIVTVIMIVFFLVIAVYLKKVFNKSEELLKSEYES